jgi:hypothetical protein
MAKNLSTVGNLLDDIGVVPGRRAGSRERGRVIPAVLFTEWSGDIPVGGRRGGAGARTLSAAGPPPQWVTAENNG